MRPIDADKLVKELTHLKHDKEEYGNMGEWYDYCIDDCINKIKNTPTVDVVPTTHAYWKMVVGLMKILNTTLISLIVRPADGKILGWTEVLSIYGRILLEENRI